MDTEALLEMAYQVLTLAGIVAIIISIHSAHPELIPEYGFHGFDWIKVGAIIGMVAVAFAVLLALIALYRLTTDLYQDYRSAEA